MKPTHPTASAPQNHVKRGPTARLLTAEERRRAQRVLLRMPVVVRISGKPAIEANTHTVSENGAMLILPDPIPEGTKLSIENPKSQKTVEARVVRPPQMSNDGAQVPVEFLSPSPAFWNIFFPPIVN